MEHTSYFEMHRSNSLHAAASTRSQSKATEDRVSTRVSPRHPASGESIRKIKAGRQACWNSLKLLPRHKSAARDRDHPFCRLETRRDGQIPKKSGPGAAFLRDTIFLDSGRGLGQGSRTLSARGERMYGAALSKYSKIRFALLPSGAPARF